jgi:hypothetical protein
VHDAKTIRLARDHFISIVDELLPDIDSGGWGQLKRPETRRMFDELARYANRLGFKHSPVNFHTETINDPTLGWGSCLRVDRITVNEPYSIDLTTVQLSDPVYVSSLGIISEAECGTSHCVLYHALVYWRTEVEATLVESSESIEEPSKGKRSKTGPRKTRGINDQRAYELVKDEKMTLKQAGAKLAMDIGREDPFSTTAVSKAVDRYVGVLAGMGVSEKARSVALKAAHELRDDDA